MLQPGTIVGGRLRVDQILGAGGMGIVVAATHLELGNKVAIKILRDELAQSSSLVERFIREARAVVNLRTEHVCRVLDVGRFDNGVPYIVMELLAGSDLARAIAQRPLPIQTAVDYIIQACAALAEAHAMGIVHRDLKPANLFVTRRPDGGPLVKVLDFGIAKATDAAGPALTHTSGMMGSPGYMSPEQLVSPRDVDARTDIWALGVTLYQLVSGRMPFPAPTLPEIAIRVANEPPVPLDIDMGLGAIIERCLRKNPAERYPTATALAQDLARFASSDGRRVVAAASVPMAPAAVVATPAPVDVNAPTAASVPAPSTVRSIAAPTAPRPPSVDEPPARRRSRWPYALVALVLVGGGVTAAVLATQRGDAPAPAPAPPAPTPVAIVPLDASDPWAPTDAGAVAVDAASAPAAETEDEADATSLEDLAAVMATATGSDAADALNGVKAMMQMQCAQAVREKIPPKTPPAALVGLGLCYCVLGDLASAKKIVAQQTDPLMRANVVQSCAQFGVKLK